MIDTSFQSHEAKNFQFWVPHGKEPKHCFRKGFYSIEKLKIEKKAQTSQVSGQCDVKQKKPNPDPKNPEYRDKNPFIFKEVSQDFTCKQMLMEFAPREALTKLSLSNSEF